jgi:hypothetical protein
MLATVLLLSYREKDVAELKLAYLAFKSADFFITVGWKASFLWYLPKTSALTDVRVFFAIAFALS